MYTLDRFEETSAVLVGDDGGTINLPRENFAGRREGDVFDEREFVFNEEETKKRRESNRALYKKLLERGKKC